MARNIRAPTTAILPDTLRIPSTARSLIRCFSRLSRTSIISLALEWLEPRNQPLCSPYLSSNRSPDEEIEEDYAYKPSDSIEELREIYQRLLEEKSTKRDVIDRILGGDWRRGISLRQLAMLDFKCLDENESCFRWTALKLVEHSVKEGKEVEEELTRRKNSKAAFPSVRVSTFIQNIQREIAPLVKSHYHVHRLRHHNLTILRLFVSDTPYSKVPSSTQRTFTDPARTIFISFPESCPFIYVSVSGTQLDTTRSGEARQNTMADIASLKRMVLEAVPKALSRPQQRIGLQSTSLTAKSLSTMTVLRGNSRSNAANGAFSIFADGVAENGPLSAAKQEPIGMDQNITISATNSQAISERSQKRLRSPLSNLDSNVMPDIDMDDVDGSKGAKKRKLDAQKRFGTTGQPSSTMISLSSGQTPAACARLDRFAIKLAEPLSSRLTAGSNQNNDHADADKPPLSITFQGSHVFAGIRLLVEGGIIDAKRMPSWMTGEDCISSGVVKAGKIIDGKGGGA